MPRLPSVVFLLLSSVVLAGCGGGALRQARTADELRDYDLAVAEYAKALRADPNNREARAGLERARLQASEAHLARGRRLFAQGRYEDAALELQIAWELNPASADAERDLRGVRAALRAQRRAPAGGPTPLESVLARAHALTPPAAALPDVVLPGTLTTGRQATSREVYLLLAQIGRVGVTFEPAFTETTAQVSLPAGTPIRQALDAVAAASGTFYQVTGPNAILVIQDTPAKRREYLQEAERTFFVQNADLKETIDALRVVSDMRSIAPITGLNAFVARDTVERLQAADRFVRTFDKARPEIVVNVEVLEIDRTALKDYGARLSSPNAIGVEGTFGLSQSTLSLDDLRNLGRADIVATGIPALYYRLLKTDARTRTLANPHIRITDGTPAAANFGQDVPVPRTVISPIQQGGLPIQPQTTFEYRTVGVNIGMTPRIHANDEVTLALDIELSTLAGTGFDGLPTFGKRNVTTTIRLRDGETNILAGLIREEERTSRETIPGLGDLPVLGALFARTRREAQQTDVVIMLTPHIIRVLDLSDDDLRPLLLPREGSGAAFLDGGALVPAPPIIRGGGGAAPLR